MNTGGCDSRRSCSCGGGRIQSGDEPNSQTRTRLNRLKLHAHLLKHRGEQKPFIRAMQELSIEEAGTICEIVKRLNVLSRSSEIAEREAVSGDGGVVYVSGTEFWNAMTSTPKNQRTFFMALGVRRGIVFFDPIGNLRLRSGPCSGMSIRPVTEATTSGANVAICGSCKAFITLSDAVICSNCKASVHCRSCCASGMDGHDCTCVSSAVNDAVAALERKSSHPFCKMLFPSRQAIGESSCGTVAVTVLDALREIALPTDLLLDLPPHAIQTISRYPRLVSRELLRRLTLASCRRQG